MNYVKKIRYRSIRESGSDSVEVILRNEKQLASAMTLLSANHRDMTFAQSDAGGRFLLRATFTEQRLAEVRNYAVEQNVPFYVIKVNELGVAEPLVQRQGAARIVVELPGVRTQRAKEILGATATLEFQEVDSRADLSAAMNGRAHLLEGRGKFDRNGRRCAEKTRYSWWSEYH